MAPSAAGREAVLGDAEEGVEPPLDAPLRGAGFVPRPLRGHTVITIFPLWSAVPK